MQLLLLAAVSAGVSASALARDRAYDIQPGLRATVTLDAPPAQRVSVRAGKGASRELARLDNAAVDFFETPGIAHDGAACRQIGRRPGAVAPGCGGRARAGLLECHRGRPALPQAATTLTAPA
ncbi:MAG: hypothetical protein ACN6O8_14935 [Achromobacter sp.]|uniref:hypothetical protein n=1 Tax=Achromobacter sp. TaxID=134375 RepID=UPI003D087133